jgi:hypothetical protein
VRVVWFFQFFAMDSACSKYLLVLGEFLFKFLTLSDFSIFYLLYFKLIVLFLKKLATGQLNGLNDTREFEEEQEKEKKRN